MTDQLCLAQCISVADAWRRQNPGQWRDFSDGDSMRCAACPGYVCMLCGNVPVPRSSMLCAACHTQAGQEHWEARELPSWRAHASEDALGEYEEIAAWPDPRRRLSRLVGEIVQLTGKRYSTVNSVLNAELGVATRSGADETVVRRAVVLALCWRDAVLQKD